jgi:hypothetical protein
MTAERENCQADWCSAPFAPNGEFLEPDQADATCPVLRTKIFPFAFCPNQIHKPRRPAPMNRGAFRDRHGRWRGMRWTRMRRETNGAARGRRSRVVLTPRCWRQLATMRCIARGWWQKSPVTKESAKETVKTIRVRECRVNRRDRGGTYSCGFYFSHARLRVRLSPGIPHALFGRRIDQQLGCNAPRECLDASFVMPGL